MECDVVILAILFPANGVSLQEETPELSVSASICAGKGGFDLGQQDEEEVRRSIEEKRAQLKQARLLKNRDEELRLGVELNELWEKVKGPLPRIALFGKSRFTFWDRDLQLDDGPGVDFAFALGTWAGYDEEGGIDRVVCTPVLGADAGTLGFGLRYGSAHDDRNGGDVDIVTYEILRAEQAHVWPSGIGLAWGFSFGLTRFRNNSPGGDRDTAFDLTAEVPHLTYAPSPAFRVGAGITWDVLKTSFNQGATHTVYSFSPFLSLEVWF